MQREKFQEDGKKILADFHEWVQGGASGAEGWNLEKENHEGWRVSIEEGEGNRGWALLRASLHDPLLVLNVESDVRGGEHPSSKQLLQEALISRLIVSQIQCWQHDSLLVPNVMSDIQNCEQRSSKSRVIRLSSHRPKRQHLIGRNSLKAACASW